MMDWDKVAIWTFAFSIACFAVALIAAIGWFING